MNKKIIIALISTLLTCQLIKPVIADVVPADWGYKAGYIDKTGKIIIEPKYDDIWDFKDGKTVAWKDKRCIFIDKQGNILNEKCAPKTIYNQTNSQGVFSEGLVAYKQDGKWGYKDNAGKIVIKPQFYYTHPFKNGVAIFEGKAGHYKIDKIPTGFIALNDKGNIIKEFDEVESQNAFNEGLIAFKVNDKVDNSSKHLKGIFSSGKWGYIDKFGKIIIKPQYNRAQNFSERLAAVETSQGWGYINKFGEVIIKPQFNRASSFIDGVAVVLTDGSSAGKYGLINKNGDFIFKIKNASISDFSDGLAAVYLYDPKIAHPKVGFIDKSGNWVIKPQYNYVNNFSEGLAAVCIDGKWGFINKTGKMVVKPQFDYVESFKNGVAKVKMKPTPPAKNNSSALSLGLMAGIIVWAGMGIRRKGGSK